MFSINRQTTISEFSDLQMQNMHLQIKISLLTHKTLKM